jgi:hypothetical protein
MKRMVGAFTANGSTAAATAATAGGGDQRIRSRKLGPAREFGTLGIATCQCDFTVDQDDGQCLRPGAFQKSLHHRVFSVSHRLLRKIESLNNRATLLGPRKVSGEIDQLLINICTAYAGAAAERGIENLNIWHESFSKS